MPPSESIGKLAIVLVLLLATLSAFPYLWYRRTYKPGLLAVQALEQLSTSLGAKASAWRPGGKASIQGLWTAMVPFYTNEVIKLLVEGRWEGAPATIQFKFPAGDIDGAYLPLRTILRITTKRPLAKWAGINRYQGSDVGLNKAFAFLGVVPKLNPVSKDLFTWGEDGDIPPFFTPSVLERIRSLPNELFGVFGTEGLVIQGSEVRITFAGQVTDPKLVEAGFRVLETIGKM
jgi:hypothetical protein